MSVASSKRVYNGRIISVDLDTVDFPNGTTGTLEMVRHPGASAIVPFLDDPESENPRVVLIRQYRHAADGFLLEIPAGRLDAGETPEACALRELREETGYSAGRTEHLTTFYTTPGFTDERIHLFRAWDLTAGDAARESDEILELEVVPLQDAARMARTGEIVDGKSMLGILLATVPHRG
jgi:ADP-ribose pyrophosphatase